jgi:hypothetical protein
MFRLALAAGAFALPTAAAVAADSVVLGHGVSNAFVSAPPCPAGSACMEANYLWVLEADRTITGPDIKGKVRAIAVQHTDATAKFVTSVELFVLRPIQDPSMRKSLGADYYLVSLSPRDPQGQYCLSLNPGDVGLKLDASEVRVDTSSGHFCFSATALTSNNRWRGP